MNVSEACRELAAHGLVPWSSGNASMRLGPLMRIKASGVRCDSLPRVSNELRDCGLYPISGFDLVISVWLVDGKAGDTPVKQLNKPSTDSEAHRYIYNHLPEINGVVHTHSAYATAFAVAGKEIPCCMTMMEDEFGGSIPISAYCDIGDDSIGREVVRLYEATKVPAILIRHHGLFTIGPSLEAAVKSAVLAEHCAHTAFISMRMANPMVRTKAEIEQNRKRYHESYGQ